MAVSRQRRGPDELSSLVTLYDCLGVHRVVDLARQGIHASRVSNHPVSRYAMQCHQALIQLLVMDGQTRYEPSYNSPRILSLVYEV